MTAAWHPALVAAAGALPDWGRADEPPELESLADTLVIAPSVSRDRLAFDWRRRFAAARPAGAAFIEATADRAETVSALLAAAGTLASADQPPVDAEIVRDFHALAYAHQQTMLLTQAMRYASVFDAEKFAAAVVAAARAAVAGQSRAASDGIDRALDLLADARNHYYAVDFYLVDVTLVARSTLGEPLRRRLAGGHATTLLADAELVEQLADRESETYAELQRAIAAGSVSVAGGLPTAAVMPNALGPEALLAELSRARQVYRRHLGQTVEVYAQFTSAFSPLLPSVLVGLGFRGALHAAFDGGRVPIAEQCKTRWGPNHETSLDALSAVPLDTARPETWLGLAERISDSISRDHVATVLLAGWPGQEFAAYDDLCRVARRSPLLGKLVTLDQYFQLTSTAETWSTFHPTAYHVASEPSAAAITSRIAAYRGEVADVHRQLVAGLRELVPEPTSSASGPAGWWTLNPWNFDTPHYRGLELVDDPPANEQPTRDESGGPQFLAAVPGCGFAWHSEEPTTASSQPIAAGRRLCNERLEIVVSERTGGIQSLRTHRERRTRVSQRLICRDPGVRTLAESLEITRNDAIVGEITSRGRLVDAAGGVIANFTQTVRLPRALPAVLVDVTLDAIRPAQGSGWTSAIASRIAWREAGGTIRYGANWVGRPTNREPIDSAEWVEIDAAAGRTSIFPLGLPFHRRVDETLLDTLLAVAGESSVRRQFAIGLDVDYPTQMAVALLTAAAASATKTLNRPATERGWFFHLDAKNVILTHVQPLAAPRRGVRMRLLETEGRRVRGRLAAFRPLVSGRQTDLRGELVRSLRIDYGAVCLNLEPHQWLQLEAEW
jgi:alpha-mannosidase